MEKVNEVGRFKQRAINYMYSSGYQCFDLNLNLELLHPQRFTYFVKKENLSMFLDYVGYLTIPKLDIKNCKTKIGNRGKEANWVYLIVSGKKSAINIMDNILNRLSTGLKR
jgi:hypothetical protein